MSVKAIGKIAYIIDKLSIYNGEWGTIRHIDADGYYHIAIANDPYSLPIFERSQIRIRKEK